MTTKVIPTSLAIFFGVFAGNFVNAEDETWVEDAKAYISQSTQEDAQDPQGLLQEVQSGGRMWVCFARARNGQTFSARSRNANVARRSAMNRCITRSNGCSLRSCR